MVTNKILPFCFFFFLFCSCSSCFSEFLDGSYEWDKGEVRFEGFCCQAPIIDPHPNDWKTSDVIKSLNTLNSSWFEYIGWIPFFNTSILLSDLRIEYDYKYNLVDCTHFIYSPIAYQIVWWDISLSIQTLKDYQRKRQKK